MGSLTIGQFRGPAVKIEILYLDGCPHHQLAGRRVHEVLEELQVHAEVIHVNVGDAETAARVRFPGSPTIRVNGEDVAPSPHGEPYGIRCRVYPTDTGFDGAPHKLAIRNAIVQNVP